jgi:hypothetical protein
VKRVVLPLASDAGQLAVAARARGIGLSFFSVGLGGQAASTQILKAAEAGNGVHFVFNGAQFARAGEAPFGSSYKGKLRRFVDQLDLEDCTYDGTPTPLACGNAEVKEMISSLRCSSFGGTMVLGAGNRPVENLRQTVTRFMGLLENM